MRILCAEGMCRSLAVCFRPMSSLSEARWPVSECAAELVMSQRWSAVSLSAAPHVGPRWLIASLLLALSRRGVFTTVTPGEPPVDRPAAGGATSAVLLLSSSLELVANSRGRPLLVLALGGASEEHVRQHAARLVGALVYDVPTGAVYRATRYLDVGPPVRDLGRCGNLSEAMRESIPLGWQDVRVVNKTYNIIQAESYDRKLASAPYSTLHALQQTMILLREAMQFNVNDLNMTEIRFIDALALFKNGTIDFMPDYFGDTSSRREFLSFPLTLSKTHGVLFLGTPALESDSGLGGVFSTDAGLGLLAGTGLLLVLACRLLLCDSEPGLLASALQAIRLLCNQGLRSPPRRGSQYVAGAAACLAALLVCQFYTAGLLSRVTTGRRRLPFERPEHMLLSADWQSVIYNGSSSQDLLLARYRGRDDVVRAIYRVSRQPTAGDEPWTARAERGRFAFFAPEDNWQRQCASDRCPRLCWCPEPVFSTRSGIPFRRHLAEEDAWRLALLRVQETGLWKGLLKRQVPVIPGSPMAACDLAPRPRTHASGLGLDSCRQAFMVLLTGAAAAVLLLTAELLLARLTRKHGRQT